MKLSSRIALLLVVLSVIAGSMGCTAVHPWPPVKDEAYPDLRLFDESGATVQLSELKGTVLLIEPIRMGCPACQAFSGAHQYGSFGAVMPQAGVEPLEPLLGRHVPGLAPTTRGFQVVQIVFYGLNGGAPSPAELRAWTRHFHLKERNVLVLGAPAEIADIYARQLIPGFQLVDDAFVLRASATGTQGGAVLSSELLPMIPTLLANGAPPPRDARGDTHRARLQGMR